MRLTYEQFLRFQSLMRSLSSLRQLESQVSPEGNVIHRLKGYRAPAHLSSSAFQQGSR